MWAGATISAIVHGSLILLALFGGFDRRAAQEEIEVSNVELISEADLQELLNPQAEDGKPLESSPDPEVSVEPEPINRQPVETEAQTSEEQEPAETVSDSPSPATEPPDPEERETPQPEPTIPDPVREEPNIVPPVQREVLGEESEREVVSVSETDSDPDSDAPVRQAAPRIADEAAPEPSPELVEGPQQTAVVETETDEAEPEPAETIEAAAPQHTAVETVTEADETRETATTLARPLRRPQRPAESEEPVDSQPVPDFDIASLIEQIQEEQDDSNQVEKPSEEEPKIDIAELISEIQQQKTPAQSRVTLTADEIQAFKRAVQRCWNVKALSDEALRVTVILQAQFQPSGKIIAGSIKLLDSTGGSGRAVEAAYETARRALVRCLDGSFSLPADRYEDWRRVEFVFDPKEMRRR